jgi:hypothetical protein
MKIGIKIATSRPNDGGGGVGKMKTIKETPTTTTKVKLSLSENTTPYSCIGEHGGKAPRIRDLGSR